MYNRSGSSQFISALIITSWQMATINAANATISNVCYLGKAYDRETDALLYTEYHHEKYKYNHLSREIVNYIDPKGNEFATKQLDFSSSKLSPQFRLNDKRDGYTEGAKIKNNRLYLFSRRSDKHSMKEISIEKPVVIDSGFDHFIRQHFKKLQNDEKLFFKFAAPIELDTYEFSIKKINDDSTKDTLKLEMTLNSALLRLFVDPITLSYSTTINRLLTYEGISNINDDKGKSHQVKIYYHYDACP